MSERLIMLDVPGVLYSDRSAARLGGIPNTGTLRDLKFFDPIALGFIRRLFGLTGARVVLSDAWRHGMQAAILQQLDLQVEAMTPPVAGGHGAEIAAYFDSRPAPQAYVIVSAREASIQPAQRPHLVTSDPAEGLTLDNFRQALDLLGVACPSTLYPDSQPDAIVQARLRQLQRRSREIPPADLGLDPAALKNLPQRIASGPLHLAHA